MRQRNFDNQTTKKCPVCKKLLYFNRDKKMFEHKVNQRGGCKYKWQAQNTAWRCQKMNEENKSDMIEFKKKAIWEGWMEYELK